MDGTSFAVVPKKINITVQFIIAVYVLYWYQI